MQKLEPVESVKFLAVIIYSISLLGTSTSVRYLHKLPKELV